MLGPELTVPFERTFDARYGLRIVSADVEGGRVAGEIDVGDAVRNQSGLVHGGVFAAAAEAMASIGTMRAVSARGQAAMGLSNDTAVVAAVASGTVRVQATARSRAADAWVWSVEARDDAGALCALSRVTVAVR